MWFLRNRRGKPLSHSGLFSSVFFSYYSPHFRLLFLWAELLFLVTIATFLCLKRGTIIADNIGQAMVNLKLWLRKGSSSQRRLHEGRGLDAQSLACEAYLSVVTPQRDIHRYTTRVLHSELNFQFNYVKKFSQKFDFS